MKLHSLNLANGSTISPTPPVEVKKFLRKGRSLGHVIVFGIKPRSVNFANESTVASATPGVKNSPWNWCGVGYVTAG